MANQHYNSTREENVERNRTNTKEITANDLMAYFPKLVKTFNTRLANVAEKYGAESGSMASEDLAQDTIIKAMNNLSSFRNEASLWNWLWSISDNVMKDYLRKMSRRVPLSTYTVDRAQANLEDIDRGNENQLLTHPLVSFDTPEAQLEAQQTIDTALKALLSCPPQFSEAFTKIKIDDRSYKAVASELGISVNTVKTRVHRATQIMKEAVANM